MSEGNAQATIQRIVGNMPRRFLKGGPVIILLLLLGLLALSWFIKFERKTEAAYLALDSSGHYAFYLEPVRQHRIAVGQKVELRPAEAGNTGENSVYAKIMTLEKDAADPNKLNITLGMPGPGAAPLRGKVLISISSGSLLKAFLESVLEKKL